MPKLYSFLVNDATLPPDNAIRFRTNLLEQIYNKSWQLMIRIRMKKYNMILIGKIYKYEYLTGDKILLFIRNQIIENLWKNEPSIKQRLNPEIMNDTQLIHNFSMVLIHIKAKNWKMFC